MKRPIEVLVLENRRGAARMAVAELEASGHHVHGCHAPGEPSFPCRGVVDPADCPLDGSIDVALVVREHIHPNPSAYESGVSCALRRGVPVVEVGSSILDPFDPFITARVGDKPVVATCEDAIETFYAPLLDDIRRRCAPLLEAEGIDPSKLVSHIELVGSRLQVHLDVLAPARESVCESLAVRALDAVRAGRRTYDGINVQVHQGEPEDLIDPKGG